MNEGAVSEAAEQVAPRRGFASDNNATVHPEVLAAIARANVGHAGGYGHDAWTERLGTLLRSHFGGEAQGFPVFNGTGANVLALRAACRPWQAAICTATAHLNVDEGGAPEAIAGAKLLTVETADGKLTPEVVEARVERIGDEHAVQRRVVSISQGTELGTVYSIAEVRRLAELAHAHGMVLHMDGARLSNAAVALGAGLGEISTLAGVDVLSLGGTKNGLLGAEAVVFAGEELAEGFLWLRKQSLQLASKMRYLSAQLEAMLSDELWARCAAHANAMAARLAGRLEDVVGLRISRPVQANAVFAVLPADVSEALQQRFPFYVWDERSREVRWMCSWDTTEADVDEFAAAVREALGG